MQALLRMSSGCSRATLRPLYFSFGCQHMKQNEQEEVERSGGKRSKQPAFDSYDHSRLGSCLLDRLSACFRYPACMRTMSTGSCGWATKMAKSQATCLGHLLDHLSTPSSCTSGRYGPRGIMSGFRNKPEAEEVWCQDLQACG